MYKALFINEAFERFTSAWGSVAVPQPYGDGYIMPLGWEDELTLRGISFEVIELPEPENTAPV